MLNRYEEFEKFLKNIYDLEKIDRKIKLKRLHPFELNFLIGSLKACGEIYLLLKKRPTKIDNYINYLQRHFDLEKVNVKLEDIKESFFKEGIDKELDELNKEKNYYYSQIVKLKEGIEKLGDVKVEINKLEKEGFYLSLTKNRFNLIKDKFLNTFIDINGQKIFFKDLKVKTLTNSVKITGELIEKIGDSIIALENKIIKKTNKL